jgi:hypothetical protein
MKKEQVTTQETLISLLQNSIKIKIISINLLSKKKLQVNKNNRFVIVVFF